jgi:methylmalonyl-CoA mutase cobalamin-binding subunit
MSDLAEAGHLAKTRPTQKVRLVIAECRFDGHHTAINITWRILRGMGVEVVDLNHKASGYRRCRSR